MSSVVTGSEQKFDSHAEDVRFTAHDKPNETGAGAHSKASIRHAH